MDLSDCVAHGSRVPGMRMAWGHGQMLPPSPRVPEGVASGAAVDGGNPVPGERAKDGLIFLQIIVAPKWARVHRVPVASETATKTKDAT